MTAQDSVGIGATGALAGSREAPRGYRGTMVAPSTLDDESYLDFVQGLRAVAVGPLQVQAEAQARSLLAALAESEPVRAPAPSDATTASEPLGHTSAPALETRGAAREATGPETRGAARAAIAALPGVAVRDRLLRSSQEMLWRRVAQTYDRNRLGLASTLADVGERHGSTLHVEGEPQYPDYLREYHLQPGGYHRDELAGYVYHYGTKIFWVGSNDRDQAKTAIVESLPIPADGVVSRVVELACSAGQSTVALKRRFPEAEVWGTDIAEPVVRYAHARAVRLGVEVHFARQPAEALEFEDGSVDLVFASLLFHEVPVEVGREIVRQVARVLRPGGLFIVSDLNPAALDVDAWGEYERWWDTVHNSEPYEYDFLASDFTGALRAEFASVEVTSNGYGARWVATR